MQKRNSIFKYLLLCFALLPSASVQAEKLSVGQAAPEFQLKTQDGSTVNLADRKDKGWTVLYFYPKAGTPGCTAQACAYRDGITAIRNQNAEVYGISTDEVKDLEGFHQKHNLTFTLLSDADGKMTQAYGVKMPIVTIAKRWTFILDPKLVIRYIDDDVDPVLDAKKVAEQISKLKAGY
ncbi:MAG: peroxiredoxin [Methylococcales bacterium]|nr:peroxiredoxin [Methylococcales bacterium]